MVSISMNVSAAQQSRSEQVRKRHAEAAYTRDSEYTHGNQVKRKEVAHQLDAQQPLDVVQSAKPFRKLGAGQLKQVAVPLGKTLDETINSWRHVRREALSAVDPSEVDYQLAAAASAKIMEAEAQLALEDRLRSVHREEQQLEEVEKPSFSNEMNDLFEQASSAYAIQTEARQRGYEVASPAYFLTA